MKIKYEREELPDLVKRVNKLLEQSFGSKTRGNLERSGGEPYYIKQELDKICRFDIFGRAVSFLGINKNVGRHKNMIYYVHEVGQFIKKDGSVIRVPERHLKKAKRYARLYEENEGKEVTIISVPPYKYF